MVGCLALLLAPACGPTHPEPVERPGPGSAVEAALQRAGDSPVTNSEMRVTFAVLGSFDGPVRLDPARHGLDALPPWLEVEEPVPTSDPVVRELCLSPTMRRFLPPDTELAAEVEAAQQARVVWGQVSTPILAERLRQAIAVVQAVCEQGGVAVVDLQAWTFRSVDEWRADVFEPERVAPGQLVRILISEEDEGPNSWLHTRGLIAFGRPDVSVRNVPEGAVPAAIEMINRFVAMQAEGARVPDGQEVRMQGLPEGMFCRHGGSMDDPEFNNVHFELRWPAE